MLFKSTAMLLLIAFSFSSCKKDKENVVVPPPATVGTWIGVLTTNSAPVGSLNLVMKLDGTLEAQNTAGQKIGEGTWQLNGVNFTCSYTVGSPTPVKCNLIGTLVSPTKLNGAWGTGNSSVNGGFWNMDKQ